ncbi:MAG: helix-turn-helix domain-containing protein, partial [Acetobacteraceae bacterium]
AEIAASVGLCDPSSFGRMFRRRFGCSPSELREAAHVGHLPALQHSLTSPVRLHNVSDTLRALGQVSLPQ